MASSDYLTSKNGIYPKFLKSRGSHIFVAQHGKGNKHAILVVPALFEEHNYGISVLNNTLFETGTMYARFDFFGCGDSEGDVSEATVETWLQNVIDVGISLIEQGVESITLLGVRFGALLMLANQRHLHKLLPINQQIVWKPLMNGQAQVNQLSRLRNSNFLAKPDQHNDWLETIAQGETVSIAGYPITNKLLTSIKNLNIDAKQEPLSTLHWLELGGEKLPANIREFKDNWRDVHFIPVKCGRFWQVPEIYKEPSLEIIHKELLSLVN